MNVGIFVTQVHLTADIPRYVYMLVWGKKYLLSYLWVKVNFLRSIYKTLEGSHTNFAFT